MTDPKPEPRKWKHRAGDRYLVIRGHWVGNPEAGYDICYDVLGLPWASWGPAWRHGWRVLDHDDFNIWVLRGGKLIATLWHNEIVDDDPQVLARMAEKAGIAND